jgi:hypothetical protein
LYRGTKNAFESSHRDPERGGSKHQATGGPSILIEIQVVTRAGRGVSMTGAKLCLAKFAEGARG